MKTHHTTPDDLAHFVEGYAYSPFVVDLAVLYFTNAGANQPYTVAKPRSRKAEAVPQRKGNTQRYRRGAKRWG